MAIDWTVIYLELLLMLVAGIAVGFRSAMWMYRWQRIRLIARWRFERRLHRQRNPWVKAWVYRHRISLSSLAMLNFKNYLHAEQGRIASEILSKSGNENGKPQTIEEPTNP